MILTLVFIQVQLIHNLQWFRRITYVEPTEQYDAQKEFESCVDSGSLKVETSAFSNFNDRILPTEGSGSIVGIITRDYFGDNRVMVLNSADDEF